ncbi:uncharacterized protein (DUF488 family) [Pseudomonas sp. EB276 TE3739]|uniref:DUF488 domain-containing protein n=1 Tax=Pseudomonas TaxID=286 RepID=UPI0020A07FB1|nr:DUF488 domain-containing protein [Pseudomonas koreensis]MCP1475865.1 uncharacterized protein (DUF488 family) [Pseudomonas koreensis]
MSTVIFTIGHSTRPIDVFIQMLKSFDVNAVVDIRTVPRSRTNPQYNLDVLPDLLAESDIQHYQIASLGGLRKKSKNVPDEVNAFWDNRSFHNYADYAFSEEFEEGLNQLLRLSDSRRCAIMCSEAVWWRCHRRIVADYLLSRGVEVLHIMGIGKSTEAILNPSAERTGTKLCYPRRLEG